MRVPSSRSQAPAALSTCSLAREMAATRSSGGARCSDGEHGGEDDGDDGAKGDDGGDAGSSALSNAICSGAIPA